MTNWLEKIQKRGVHKTPKKKKFVFLRAIEEGSQKNIICDAISVIVPYSIHRDKYSKNKVKFVNSVFL